jgi:hypothetical protein
MLLADGDRLAKSFEAEAATRHSSANNNIL